MKRKFILLISITAVVAIGLYLILRPRREEIVLTGIVTTDEVIVSPEIQGRLQQLLVRAGDTVTNGQLLAVMQPQEWRADALFYTNTARQSSAQVVQAAADLQFQEEQTSNLIWQSEANLAAAKDQIDQAEADAENAALTFKREEGLYKQGVDSVKDYDSARTAYDAVKARVQSLRKQAIAAQAAVALAKSTIEQTAARRAALASSRDQQAASDAQSEKADVQLGYTLIHAPITGTVDVRAALQGEVVNPGQGVVTLIDPDDLWVRADVGKLILTASGSTTPSRCVCHRARSARERFSFAAWTPTMPRNGTSAAPSATSRPSKSACVATTRTAPWPWGSPRT
jgi:multidrug resistance efflux pump